MTRTADHNFDRQFGGGHLATDLKGRSVRGGAVTLLNRAGNFVITTATTVFLARLLDPADFGLLAMVFAMTGFIQIFRDMGLSTATLQRDKITHEQVSTLFWINTGLGAVISILSALVLAPLVAWFYGEPRLYAVTAVMGLTFLLSGLNCQHGALLRRRMQFGLLTAVELSSLALGGIAGVVAAKYFHAGYWSLVWVQLVRSIASTLATWMASPWWPGRPGRGTGVRGLLKYGGNFAGFQCLNYASRNVDNILLGWWWGPSVLGIYAKAYQILLLPTQQINMPLTGVALPVLSRLQNDPPRYRTYYRMGLMLLCALGMPVVVFLFVAADAAVLLILGPKWGDAVVIFRVLAPAAFFGTFNMAPGWVYLSCGRTDRQLRWGIFTSLVTVAAFFVGLPWKGVGVAAAFSITYCGLTMGPLSILYAFRGTPVRFRDFAAAVWRPAAASVGAGVLLFAAQYFLPARGQLWAVCLIDAALFGLFYLALWVALPGGRKAMLEVLSLAGDLRPKKRAARGRAFDVAPGTSVQSPTPEPSPAVS
jgi:O-antigen/teichoic acid export membrane protein